MKESWIKIGIGLIVLLFVCGITSRFSQVGETSELILEPTVPPVAPEPMLILTRKWLPNDMFRLVLPLKLDITKPASNETTSLIISDIRYSGQNGDWKKAKFYAIAVPAGSYQKPISLLTANDSKLDLKAVADRVQSLSDSPGWFAVLSLKATWTPWHLVFTVEGTEPRKKDGVEANVPGEYALNTLKTPNVLPSLLDLNLSNINAPLTDEFSQKLNLVPSFGENTVVFALLPTETADQATLPPDGIAGYSVETTNSTDETSLINFIPHSFMNYLLGRMANTKALKADLLGETVTVETPLVRTFSDGGQCQKNCYRFTGTIVRKDGPPVLKTFLDWNGDDLSFQKGKVQQRLCAPGNINCQTTEVKIRSGLALMNCKYGKPLNPVAECGAQAHPIPLLLRPENVIKSNNFNLNGKSISVNLLLQNTKLSGSGLYTSGFCNLVENKVQ